MGGVDKSVCDEVNGGRGPKRSESSSLLSELSVDADSEEPLLRYTPPLEDIADFMSVASSSNILSMSAILFFHPNETSNASSVASFWTLEELGLFFRSLITTASDS